MLYSEDPGSARQGGECGFKGRGEFVPEFSAVAFNLTDPNKVSKIVETEYGYHIIQLKERLGDESKVPEGVNYIPEVVINAIDEESMNKAVKAGIDAALEFDGVIGISAGNFDGKLGDKNINLLDILK